VNQCAEAFIFAVVSYFLHQFNRYYTLAVNRFYSGSLVN